MRNWRLNSNLLIFTWDMSISIWLLICKNSTALLFIQSWYLICLYFLFWRIMRNQMIHLLSLCYMYYLCNFIWSIIFFIRWIDLFRFFTRTIFVIFIWFLYFRVFRSFWLLYRMDWLFTITFILLNYRWLIIILKQLIYTFMLWLLINFRRCLLHQWNLTECLHFKLVWMLIYWWCCKYSILFIIIFLNF